MSGTRRYRFGPLEDRGVVGPLRMGQVLIVGAAALLALGALYVLRSWAGMIVALLVLGAGGALIYLPFEGRTRGRPPCMSPGMGRACGISKPISH